MGYWHEKYKNELLLIFSLSCFRKVSLFED